MSTFSLFALFPRLKYSKISSMSRTKFQAKMFLVLSCSCLHPIHWSQVLNR